MLKKQCELKTGIFPAFLGQTLKGNAVVSGKKAEDSDDSNRGI